IPKVDEDDATVVTATVHPTHQGHRLVQVFFTDLAGIAGTHQGKLRIDIRFDRRAQDAAGAVAEPLDASEDDAEPALESDDDLPAAEVPLFLKSVTYQPEPFN